MSTARYQVTLSTAAARALRRVDRPVQHRLLDAIAQLVVLVVTLGHRSDVYRGL